MDETYTKRLETEIWNMAEELDKNEDFSKVTEFLNSEEGFQPFGKRLAIFIAKKLDLDSTDRKTVVQALNEACGKTGVGLSEIASDNTFRNWFDKGTSRKKGDPSRRLSMFALAFALRLSVNETKDLFHKIYLDRAFYYRDEKEVVYYYCLKNNKSWADAARLIADVDDLSKDYSDDTQYTQAISNSIDGFQSEQDLLEHIRRNGHNFEKKSVTVKSKIKYYLSEARKCVQDETIRYQLDHKNKDTKSNNFLYETITGMNITGKEGTKTVSFKNASLPKEIKNCFPQARTLDRYDKDNNMSSEEYRKTIILLFSYWYWYQIQCTKNVYTDVDYIKDINNVLSECNFPKMYYGNPFDWMFVFCTYTSTQDDLLNFYHRPLDLFRDLLESVLK